MGINIIGGKKVVIKTCSTDLLVSRILRKIWVL